MSDSSTSDPSVDDPSSSSSDNNDVYDVAAEGAVNVPQALTEAPTGFDNKTNGFPANQTDFDDARAGFESHEEIADGLGPVYNAQGCVECHQNPVTGGNAAVTELRAGHFNGTNFIDHPGGSLINDRAVDASIQEKVLPGNEVRTFRSALSIAGDAFVESIDSNVLASNANAQPAGQRGTLIQVPVLEANAPNAAVVCNNNPTCRGGRFGHKDQNSSLHSFAADAYLNEMGITNPLLSIENTSNGRDVNAFDGKDGTDDADGADVDEFIEFMRGMKAPPRDAALAATASAQRGATQFSSIGCATCHTPTFNTLPAGTAINAGQFTVPAALGDKIIHPFGDFLLHNVGTGDGIVQNGGQGTRNQVRTAPLWGLRTKSRFMHDSLTFTVTDAINRHRGQASGAVTNFNNLSTASRTDVLAFLSSL